MIVGNLKYITGQNGHVNEVILPIAVYNKMIETLEDNKLLDSKEKGNSGTKHQNGSWLGCLADKTQIHGDITAPVIDENQWEVLSH